ncbi:CGG triplet repeat-binding protein 1 [Orchesella cincta]|uniref:CGG triplet repeat-binding protein 1 n=1 Tax=Orchesella cincta TaxID=48709 RepID=A0A1D2M378_ORCCI|nr:CGG triplet repeat-binding protein 1 [Orchesella cincta]
MIETSNGPSVVKQSVLLEWLNTSVCQLFYLSMGNQRRSAQDRAKEFKSNGLSLKNKMLWCDFCNVEVSHSRKSVIEKHVNSFQHKKRQADVKKVDPLPVVVGRQNAAKCIWSAMVASFTSAGVPLKIFRNPEVRKWIEANVKTADTLPSETTLRKLLTQEGSKDIEKTTEMCCNQSVIATVDESIDIKN